MPPVSNRLDTGASSKPAIPCRVCKGVLLTGTSLGRMVVKHVMCEYVQCRSCDTVQPLFDDREHALYFSDDDATDGRSHDNFSEALSYVPETIESVLIVEGDVVARAAYSPFGKAHGELMWFVQIDKEGDA